MYYCQNCGSPLENPPGNFCPSCGAQIPTTPGAPHQQQEQQWSGRRQTASEAMHFSGRMDRPGLKRAAKDRLSGNWGKAIGLELVMESLLTSPASISFGFLYSFLISLSAILIRIMSQEAISFLLLCLMGLCLIPMLIFWGPLKYGNDAFYLQLFHERKPPFSLLFQGFSCFGKSCWMGVLKFLLLTGWTLLFAIPGIVKQLSYSMSYFILRDRPELSAWEAIRASKEMMKGNKGELFTLHLSFFGWVILSCLSYGLLDMFYVRQYRNACLAAFYEELKARKSPRIIPESERPLWNRPEPAAVPLTEG
ncbi:MAG: DUF975 family protein [Bacillota bacterium]|nr:DUF975 family protein [Bacillota bacterium]